MAGVVPISISLIRRHMQLGRAAHSYYLFGKVYYSIDNKEEVCNFMNEEINIENQYDKLAECVTPLYEIPYRQQLKMKYSCANRVLKKLGDQIFKANKRFHRQPNGLPCVLEFVRPSPVVNSYRNKDEFNVRIGADGNRKTVGLYVGNVSTDSAVAVHPDHLLNIKPSHVKVSHYFEKYIRKSHLSECFHLKDGGHWRGITVRSTTSGDLLAQAIMHPQTLMPEQIKEEKDKLTDYFVNGEGREANINSLFFQACPRVRCNHDEAPIDLLYGEPHLYEELLGSKFRISPDSFFQINPSCAEVLYQTVLELGQISSYTTVLDICCGTGTISVITAPYAKETIGIEVIPNAVRDAKANASLNGLSNTRFHVGQAEKVLPQIVSMVHTGLDVVAIVNPGRAGLNTKTVKAIRECGVIDRIIYVSCNPEGLAFQNFLQLCGTKQKVSSRPFIPRIAIPVDMFPHTLHYELVIMFERSKEIFP